MASATYFIAFLSLLCLDLSCGIEMSLNKNAESGQSLDIIIDIGQITALMTLTRPGGSTETCFAPIGGNPGSCTTGLSQDFATGKTTFTIGSVLRSRDEGEWTSSHGSDPPGSINITVLTIPTSLNVSQTIQSLALSAGTSNTQTLTVVVPCVYPEASLSLAYVPAGGGSAVSASSSTSTCTSTGNTGCSDTDVNSYTCTITPQYEAGLVAGTTYNIQVTVNLDGQYQSIGFSDTITDTSIIMQANPDPNPDCPCTGETVLLSLSIAIMCMVLMHAWLVFLFTKGIIKWNIPTVSKCDNEKSPVNIIVVTITISLCCVIGMVLCAVGMSICQKCTSSDDNTGLILAIVGFVLVVVGLVVDILYVCIFQKKTAKCDQRNRPDGQEDNTFKKKETLPPIEDKSTDNSPRSRGSPTSASKIQTKINKMSGQVSDSNESDGGETARSKLGNVPVGRKLPPLQPGAEQSQPSEDTTGVKKLKKKKKKKNKEEQKNDKEDDNE